VSELPKLNKILDPLAPKRKPGVGSLGKLVLLCGALLKESVTVALDRNVRL